MRRRVSGYGRAQNSISYCAPTKPDDDEDGRRGADREYPARAGVQAVEPRLHGLAPQCAIVLGREAWLAFRLDSRPRMIERGQLIERDDGGTSLKVQSAIAIAQRVDAHLAVACAAIAASVLRKAPSRRDVAPSRGDLTWHPSARVAAETLACLATPSSAASAPTTQKTRALQKGGRAPRHDRGLAASRQGLAMASQFDFGRTASQQIVPDSVRVCADTKKRRSTS